MHAGLAADAARITRDGGSEMASLRAGIGLLREQLMSALCVLDALEAEAEHVEVVLHYQCENRVVHSLL